MDRTSDWPLAERAERHLLPLSSARQLLDNPLTSSCYPLAAGFYPEAHGHRMARLAPTDHLVIYCVSGTATLMFDGISRTVCRGDLLLLPAGQPHHYQASDDNPWSLYWAHLGGAALPALFALFGQPGVLSVGMSDQLLRDFRALLAVVASGYTDAALLHASHLCQSLLSHALLALQHHRQEEALDLQAVHVLMAQQLDRRLTLAELTRAAGYRSPWQFIRHYRQATGQTPMQAFLHRKISEASYLLETTDLPIRAIGERVGVDDPYYFSRLFRRVTGVSPTQYRRQGVPPTPVRQ